MLNLNYEKLHLWHKNKPADDSGVEPEDVQYVH